MRSLLLLAGRVAGFIGLALCAMAIVVRLTGSYVFAGFEVGTLFQAGIAAMVGGCLAYCASLAERT